VKAGAAAAARRLQPPGAGAHSGVSSAWKAEIIALTEGYEARAAGIDASFFPPLGEDDLSGWEIRHGVTLPPEIRSYLLQSDGLEAARGLLWPVLPLARWEMIDDPCASAHPWIRFGESGTHRYLLSLGHSPSIHRHETFGSDGEFFAPTFRAYLRKVFEGES
jgi:hypothetical protein